MMGTPKSAVSPPLRGDPRMNRAVQLKLDNPMLPLSEALRLGGFCYPPKANGFTVDAEGVSLSQRKNQLNRRVRRANNRADKHPADRVVSSEASEAPKKKQKVMTTEEWSATATLQGQMSKMNSLPEIPVHPIKQESAVVSALRNCYGVTRSPSGYKAPAALGPATIALKSTNMDNEKMDIIFNQKNPMYYPYRLKEKTADSNKPGSSRKPDQRSKDSFLDAILLLPAFQENQCDHSHETNDEAELLDAPVEVNLPTTPTSNDFASCSQLADGLGTLKSELRTDTCLQRQQRTIHAWSPE